MKTLQVWGWLISGFLRKHKKILLLGISLGVGFAIFIIWVLPYIPRPSQIEKIGIIGQYRTDTLPEFVTSKVGHGLTAILKDGSPAPALADRWTVDEEGMVYTFFIRDNVYWHDGSKVTADTLQYTFSDVETKVLDEKTIQFALKSPFSPFPTLVSNPLLKNNTIGTGEYRLKKFKYRGGYVESVVLESPQNTIHVKFYPNLKNAMLAFTLGEIDEIQDIYKNPFDEKPEWKNKISVTSTRKTNQYMALFMNNNDPLLKDKTFRQALAYATQKPIDDSRALGPISIDSWAYNTDIKRYEFDPKRALELLEKSFGNLEKTKDITLRLSTTQSFLQVAENIKKDWESALSIKVEIEVINNVPENFQVLLMTEQIPSDPDQYPLWHSTQQQNFIKFNNKRIDKILEDARTKTETDKREELYYDFQRFFVEESPVIFISYPETFTIKRNSSIRPIFNRILQFGKASV